MHANLNKSRQYAYQGLQKAGTKASRMDVYKVST
uniref:Uncharacterized protein n=1 Tax=Arundo donax TaxID=35708 RepID=A0A0A8ZN07_ARUDO